MQFGKAQLIYLFLIIILSNVTVSLLFIHERLQAQGTWLRALMIPLTAL